MKPLYLSIEGLQSFQEKQEIDFNKISRDGIFGIFGPTGSGKSTIIDAITLALYGSILRFKDNKDEKKDYMTTEAVNKNSNMTKVNFKFKVGDDTYRIERTYKIGKKSGKLSKTALLFKVADNEEKIAEGHTEIYKEVTQNILGLTLEDFTRSVVLPQGNFSEFLKLTGDNKRKMLERIFNLEKYGDALSKKVNAHKKNLEDKLKEVNTLIENIGFNEEDLKNNENELIDLEKELESLKNDKKDTDNKIKELEEISKIEDKLFELNKEEVELKKEEEGIKVLISQRDLATKFNPIIEKIEKKEEVKENIDSLEKEISTVKNELKTYQEKFDKEEINYNTLEKEEKNLYKQKEELYVSQEEYDKLNNIYNDLLKKESLIKKIDTIKEDIDEQNLKKDTFKDDIREVEEKISDLNNEKEKINIIPTKDIIDLEKAIIEKENNKKLVDNKKEEYNKQILRLDTLNKKETTLSENLVIKEKDYKKYTADRKAYLVYELEKEMKAGEPCPLCGNKYHEKHSSTQELSFDKDNFEKLKKEINNINQELFSLKENIKNTKEEIDNTCDFDSELSIITKELDELKLKKEENEKENEKNKNILDKIEEKINIYKNNLNNLQIEKTKKESTLIEKKKVLEELENEYKIIPNSDTTLVEIQASISIFKDKRKKTDEIDIKLNSLREELNFIRNNKLKDYKEKIDINKNLLTKKEENYSSFCKIYKEVNQNIDEFLISNNIEDISYMNEIKDYIDNIDIINKKITEYNNKISYVTNSIKEYKILLNNRIFSKDRYENLSNYANMLETLLEKNSQKIGETKNQIKTLKEKKQLVKDKIEEKDKIELELNPAKEIYELLKGRKFIEFLSAGKLQTITRIASNTLQKITNGRYRINVDEKSNFSILDNFSSAIRIPQSLSGGETFMVSLCLALALANQIQLRGKSKLEFFFLDEGFGTLDADLLEIVFSVLENLKANGMTVGIITHVEEIKNRVPRKLIVIPAKIGISGTLVKEV